MLKARSGPWLRAGCIMNQVMVVVPVLAAVLLITLTYIAVRVLRKFRRRRTPHPI